MPFFKPLLLLATFYGVCKLGSYLFSDDSPPSSPPPSPPSYPRSRSRSPRRAPRLGGQHAQAPSPHRFSSSCLADRHVYQGQPPTTLQPQRPPVKTVSEHQPLSRQNVRQHHPRVESSPITDPYRSHDHHNPQVEPVRNAGASNKDDERDPHYVHLRNEAQKYCVHMRKSYDESQKAYSQGDHVRAKELSNKGGEYKGHMEVYDKQASEWIFNKLNKDNDPYNVDLHGLYVKEAIPRVERKLKEARARGAPSIRFIVGQGRHADDGIPKLKPAIENLIRESGLSSRIEQFNPGALIVDFDSHSESRGRDYLRDRTNQG
ncbi:hypothetical protein AGABI1DRAFT_126606 [Agaricus bisporus var. burnettii JB137-S8]|uniref:Smr domain-containing protein n=1 Tax=Agaricus bisporus var. burnettii (strain JB137-S8 / ATCC MYA-4627 / FGSC 10392) TaxID=597362 RepID=K5WYF8_AGABU|nr:uncharacterized protein AGABI1DRAFT_126606 [Agaricus bisporus var. burnettii JB137-S8]EKM80546.1 hypothetical protein AGABI1DRAFT_126606 [Agaricus bisporus var. burnettii JB137-S8]